MGMFKGGGGFLNNVVGTIIGTSFDTLTGTGDKGPWTKLSMEISVLQDGQTEPVQTFLDGGFLYEEDGAALSADKLTIEGGDGAVIQGRSEVAQFIGSLVKAGFPEASLDENGRNFQGLVGARVKFVKVKDEERTQRQGKQKGKDGKGEYDYQQLRVSEVLASDPKAAKAATAAAKKAAPAKTKGAAKAAPAADVDYTGADEALTAVLNESAEGQVEKGTLSSSVVKYALAKGMSGADREALRKLVTSEAYLASAAERNLIVIGGDAKKPIIVKA